MRYTVIQFARESVGLCPFCGSYVREFELSFSNPASRIIKITHAHNLYVKMLDFVPFTVRTYLFTRKFAQTILKGVRANCFCASLLRT